MTGADIMKHRRKMNYTTDKLAQKVGVTVDTVQKWERDIMKPRENNRVRLHIVLGLGHPFRRKLTDAQRLAKRKRRIELTAKLDAKVDEREKLGSWSDIDDNDPLLIKLREQVGVI